VARNLLTVFLGATIVFVSCSQPTSSLRVADGTSSPLKNRIPPPDPNKYLAIRDARDWQNPYLIVQANGIYDQTSNAATEVPRMPLGDVVAYLERLPPSAWPYGLVVAVQESSLRNPNDDAPIKRTREELVRLLEKAGIKVNLWPS
jgi:hypothetical protein